MGDWSVKIAQACDADYRNKILHKQESTGTLKTNHEVQVYHLMLYLSAQDILQLYSIEQWQHEFLSHPQMV